MIAPEVLTFTQDPVFVALAAADASGGLDITRAVGVAFDGARLTTMVADALGVGAPALAAFLDGQRVAVTLAAPTRPASFQVKGRVLATRAPTEADLARARRDMAALGAHVQGEHGVDGGLYRDFPFGEGVLVEIEVTECFDQRPGPGAGTRLGGPPASQPAVIRRPARPEPLDPTRTTRRLPPEIRPCLEGVLPAQIATLGPDGTPNLSYLSQVWYVDDRHVALSWQFFNKTTRNLEANPRAAVQTADPRDLQFWNLHTRLARVETEGPLFEAMSDQLEVIASFIGMKGIFKLHAAMVHEVEEVIRLPFGWHR